MLNPNCGLEVNGRHSWYSLSDANYGIVINESQLYKLYDGKKSDTDVFLNYYLAAFHDDLMDMMADIINPIPGDINDLIELLGGVAKWDEISDNYLESLGEDEWMSSLDSIGWHSARRIDNGYLALKINIWIWRVGDIIFIEWMNNHNLSDEKDYERGSYQIQFECFLDKIKLFHSEMMSGMLERLEELRLAPDHYDFDFDIDHLMDEHFARELKFERSFEKSATPIDWDLVRSVMRSAGQIK